MKKIMCGIGLLAFIAMVSVGIAGTSSTDPKNEKIINDPANHAITIKPKLTIDWAEKQESGKSGLTKMATKVKYEIENTSKTTGISIVSVKLLNKTDKSVAWKGLPVQQIEKKKTGKWESGDLKSFNQPLADSLIEVELSCVGRNWYLLWDPGITGKENLTVSETKTATDEK